MRYLFFVVILPLILGALVPQSAAAQIPRLISYQGIATDAFLDTGTHRVRVNLYTTETGGTPIYQQQTDEIFVNGLFATHIGPIPESIDFSTPYWIGIAFDETAEVEPRIRLSTSPYAFRAERTDLAAVATRALDADRADEAGRSDSAIVAPSSPPDATGFVRSSNGRLGDLQIVGAGGTNVQVDGSVITISTQISGGGPDDAWLLGGNDATAPGIDYLGTSDDKAFEIHVDHDGARLADTEGRGRVLRFEPTGGSPNILGGFHGNTILGNTGGVTLSGGGETLELQTVAGDFGTIGGGRGNRVADNDGTVAGGRKNDVDGVAGVIGGGQSNRIAGDHATIAGGLSNVGSGSRSSIGGGAENRTNSIATTIGGGEKNAATGVGGTISGGVLNRVFGNYGTVGGGEGNATAKEFSTVAGGRFNFAAVLGSTVGGGVSDSATGSYATVSGGLANVASDLYTTIGGGQANRAEASNATIGGGTLNKATGKFATIPGGYGLTVSGDYSFGFFSGPPATAKRMELAQDNVALFANADLYLGANDGTARRIVLFEPVTDSGIFPGLNDHYSAFRAGEQNSSIDYILPTTLGSQGDILSIASINGTTATLSWVSSQGTPSSIATNDAVANDPALVAKLVEELRRSTEELEATRALLERALDQLDAAAKTGSPAESR